MYGVEVALGSRCMTVEAARQMSVQPGAYVDD